MILNEEDLLILQEFNNLSEDFEKNPTTWEIMLKLFPNCKNIYEKRKHHDRVKKRIKRMNDTIFFIEKNKKGFYEYTLIEDNVIFCKHKFPCGMRNAVQVFDGNKWMILQM